MLSLILFIFILLVLIVFFKIIRAKQKLFSELHNLIQMVYNSEDSEDKTDIASCSRNDKVKKNVEEIIEENGILFLYVSRSNSPVILSNVSHVISQFRADTDMSEEKEKKYFSLVYDCIRKPNIGRIRLNRELESLG